MRLRDRLPRKLLMACIKSFIGQNGDFAVTYGNLVDPLMFAIWN